MKLFLSYRRADSQHITDRIYDRLTSAFGEENVFKDVDSIPLGVPFHSAIKRAVEGCNILIAVIGRQWLSTKDEAGNLRLLDEEDFVRMEIETALQHNIFVVPVFVDGAKISMQNELPSGLQSLPLQNGISVNADPQFHDDVNRLIEQLRSTKYTGRIPRLRVMVVDEILLNRRFASRVISSEGHIAKVVENTDEAFSAMSEYCPDLLLLQARMSFADAFEFARIVRETKRKENDYLPILGMSSDATAQRRCLDGGMDGCLNRPVTVREFREQVNALLSHVDILHMLASCNQDRGLVNELLDVFLEDIPSIQNEIREAVAERNFVQLAQTAHGLAGHCSGAGASSAAKLARRFEEMGRSQKLRDAEQLQEDLQRELEKVCFAINHGRREYLR